METGLIVRQLLDSVFSDLAQGVLDGSGHAPVDLDPGFAEFLNGAQAHPSADDNLDPETFDRSGRMTGAVNKNTDRRGNLCGCPNIPRAGASPAPTRGE